MNRGSEEFQALLEADPAAAARALEQVKNRLFLPHEGGQRLIIGSQARFRTCRAGRRWGKTKVAAHEIINAALSKNGSMNWWVANRWKNTRRGYREVVRQLPKALLERPAPADTSNELVIRLKNGSRIEFYSGESPDSLAGEGVDFVVIDEAALIRESTWYQLIRPTLMDTGGRALIISTPRGRNWFWKLAKLGEEGVPGYESFHFRQSDNPYIPASETEEARRTLPDIFYRQEIEAEWVSSAASIFAVPESQILNHLSPPAGHVVLGIDLAKKEDFTVIDGARAADAMPCFHERMKEVSWPVQRDRIVQVVRDLERDPNVDAVTACIDSTGVGDVVVDHLEEAGLDVVSLNFGSGQWKEKAVKLLGSALESGEAYILEEQVEEFESYEYEITDAGRYKFAAASGHDDEVSAKMLQQWGIVHEAGGEPVKIIEYGGEADIEASPEPTLITPDSPSDVMRRAEAWG